MSSEHFRNLLLNGQNLSASQFMEDFSQLNDTFLIGKKRGERGMGESEPVHARRAQGLALTSHRLTRPQKTSPVNDGMPEQPLRTIYATRLARVSKLVDQQASPDKSSRVSQRRSSTDSGNSVQRQVQRQVQRKVRQGPTQQQIQQPKAVREKVAHRNLRPISQNMGQRKESVSKKGIDAALLAKAEAIMAAHRQQQNRDKKGLPRNRRIDPVKLARAKRIIQLARRAQVSRASNVNDSSNVKNANSVVGQQVGRSSHSPMQSKPKRKQQPAASGASGAQTMRPAKAASVQPSGKRVRDAQLRASIQDKLKVRVSPRTLAKTASRNGFPSAIAQQRAKLEEDRHWRQKQRQRAAARRLGSGAAGAGSSYASAISDYALRPRFGAVSKGIQDPSQYSALRSSPLQLEPVRKRGSSARASLNERPQKVRSLQGRRSRAAGARRKGRVISPVVSRVAAVATVLLVSGAIIWQEGNLGIISRLFGL
jgi:hypothetical protein